MKHIVFPLLAALLLSVSCGGSSESGGSAAKSYDGVYYAGPIINGAYAHSRTISGTTETCDSLEINASGIAVSRWVETFSTAVEGDYLDGQKICLTLTKRTITVLTDDEAAVYNSSKACGFSDWVKGTPKDVGIKQWDGTDQAPYYTIRLLLNNRFYFGKKTSDYTGASDLTRPREFDFAASFFWVKL